jgi:hypothetical protein
MLYTLTKNFGEKEKPILASRCDTRFVRPAGFSNDGLCLSLFVEGEEVYKITEIHAMVKC